MERCHNCGNHAVTESGPCCTLYEKIDIARVQCLNELAEGSGVTVFKPWEERLDRTKVHNFFPYKLVTIFTRIYFLYEILSLFLFYLILVCGK